jgi:heptosyltransferase-2
VREKLLILELWGLGDLVVATPFLRASSSKYDVTVVAKPYAQDLQARFWPGVTVLPFVAPWTAFKGKYRLWRWPWREGLRLRATLAGERFEVGLAARWDPRDHFILWLSRARTRVGFPRVGSKIFLTRPLQRPDPREHRYEHWRALARALKIDLPAREGIPVPRSSAGNTIIVHTGAGQSVRVWPLERYRQLVARLRDRKFPVLVVCDPDQRAWWLKKGEATVATPQTVSDLMGILDQGSLFIGNDSGPGHLAALCGVPTFTIFGPQLPDWFLPVHPAADWIEGKACPYKPCSDYCRFPSPICMEGLGEQEVLERVEAFVSRHLEAV